MCPSDLGKINDLTGNLGHGECGCKSIRINLLFRGLVGSVSFSRASKQLIKNFGFMLIWVEIFRM